MIPDSISAPQVSKTAFTDWLNKIWTEWLDRLVGNLTSEKQVEHLDWCLELEYAQSTVNPTLRQKIWNVLQQVLTERSHSTPSEPQIRQISDREGHLWWQAYDPMTGQTTYLESEEEVMVWLEERLYF